MSPEPCAFSQSDSRCRAVAPGLGQRVCSGHVVAVPCLPHGGLHLYPLPLELTLICDLLPLASPTRPVHEVGAWGDYAIRRRLQHFGDPCTRPLPRKNLRSNNFPRDPVLHLDPAPAIEG